MADTETSGAREPQKARPGWGVGKTEATFRSDSARLDAVKRHLIAMGVQGVHEKGRGVTRTLAIDGWNARIRKNLPGLYRVQGRNAVIEDLKGTDPRPLVIFDVPDYAEDPAEVMVTIPMDDFIRILRKDYQQ